MKKVDLPTLPWVKMKDGSYEDCFITLVHEWIRVNPDETEDNMGIIVVKPENEIPFTINVKLNELDFVAFRG